MSPPRPERDGGGSGGALNSSPESADGFPPRDPGERERAMKGESKDDDAANKEMEEQLKAAIQANMTELELVHKQEEFERLQLEQAMEQRWPWDNLRNLVH